MTERRIGDATGRPASVAGASRRAAPRRASQRPTAVAWLGAAIAFVAVLAVLAVQVATGADPAIGPGEQATAPEPPKRVLVRRIVRRVIVTHETPPAAGAPGGGVLAAARGAPFAAAPAPVPAAAAAPAPAPAPPTTRSS